MEDKPIHNFSQYLASGADPQPVQFCLHVQQFQYYFPRFNPITTFQYLGHSKNPSTSKSQCDRHTPFLTHTSTSYVGCAPFLIQYICSYLVRSEVASYIHWQSARYIVVTSDPLNTLEWSPTFTNVVSAKCLS